MILETEHERSAKGIPDGWEICDRPKYRWCHVDNTPASDWFEEFSDALKWIKEYDSQVQYKLDGTYQ